MPRTKEQAEKDNAEIDRMHGTATEHQRQYASAVKDLWAFQVEVADLKREIAKRDQKISELLLAEVR